MGGGHAASPTTPSSLGPFSTRRASFDENPATLTPVELDNCKAALSVLQERLRVSDGIEHEYSALQAETITSSLFVETEEMQCARDPMNSKKNRYLDVVPFDNNRVLLQGEASNRTSDYINASYVFDPDRPALPRYIATQGPLPATREDFWAMVLQQKCQAIVSLTREVERDRPKCAHYFPEAVGRSERFGQTVVSTRELTYMQHGLIARRTVEVASSEACPSEPLLLRHYHYLDWPDHGVPASTSVIRGLLRHLRLSLSSSSPPTVIHCSAGIGRSGTFLTVDYTVRRVLAGDLSAVDIAETVKQLRALRGGMVQTRDQYRFCYVAVKEELEDLIAWGKS